LDESCKKLRIIILQTVKEERNILQSIKRRNANWIGHTLRRNGLLKHVTEPKMEGRTEVTGRRGKRLKKLLDGLKEKRGYRKMKEEALDRTLWRIRFGKRLLTCRRIDYGIFIHDYTNPCYQFTHKYTSV
jgi:hypothetical protein